MKVSLKLLYNGVEVQHFLYRHVIDHMLKRCLAPKLQGIT